MNPRLNTYLSLLFKLGITALAVWFVLGKVDLHVLGGHLLGMHPGWALVALLAFIFSKAISALRLNQHFRAQDIFLSERANLFLYALGMFYNLFLPGGIGGDGYKVYWLKQKLDAKVKLSLLSLLYDRINGLAALVFLALVLACFFPFPPALQPYEWLVYVALVALYPTYYGFVHWTARAYRKIWASSSGLSLLVQLAQLGSVTCIMLALGIRDHWLAYGLMFLVSSMVAIIPFTIGGFGSRELVFTLGAGWLGLSPDISVAISLIFYFITALVALMGGYFVLLPETIHIAHEKNSRNRRRRVHR